MLRYNIAKSNENFGIIFTTDWCSYFYLVIVITIYTYSGRYYKVVGKEYCAASSKNPVYKIGEPTPLSLFCCCSKNKFVYPFLMNEKPISFGARKVFLHFIYNIKTGAYEEERGFNFSLYFLQEMMMNQVIGVSSYGVYSRSNKNSV